MSLLWRISGSSPLGRGLGSLYVCSATLPACCKVIIYELRVEEADGQDVTAKMDSNQGLRQTGGVESYRNS